MNDQQLEESFGVEFCHFLSHEFVRTQLRLVDDVGTNLEQASRSNETDVDSVYEDCDDHDKEAPFEAVNSSKCDQSSDSKQVLTASPTVSTLPSDQNAATDDEDIQNISTVSLSKSGNESDTTDVTHISETDISDLEERSRMDRPATPEHQQPEQPIAPRRSTRRNLSTKDIANASTILTITTKPKVQQKSQPKQNASTSSKSRGPAQLERCIRGKACDTVSVKKPSKKNKVPVWVNSAMEEELVQFIHNSSGIYMESTNFWLQAVKYLTKTTTDDLQDSAQVPSWSELKDHFHSTMASRLASYDCITSHSYGRRLLEKCDSLLDGKTRTVIKQELRQRFKSK